jgi:hypothetical protein
MVSDYRAAKYFRRLEAIHRTRAAFLRQRALATADILDKTNLEAQMDDELATANSLAARAQELEDKQ